MNLLQRIINSPVAFLGTLLITGAACFAIGVNAATPTLECSAACSCSGKRTEGCTCITVAPVRCPCSDCPCEGETAARARHKCP